MVPKAPGTFGTLGAVPLAVGVYYFGVFFGALFIVIFILIAVWASGLSQKILGRDDPPEVVIDEVAGFLLTVFLVPPSWLSLCFGFLLFRFFDILKPFPIGRSEKLKGGAGVVLDDLLAGIYSNLCLRIVLFFMQPG